MPSSISFRDGICNLSIWSFLDRQVRQWIIRQKLISRWETWFPNWPCTCEQLNKTPFPLFFFCSCFFLSSYDSLPGIMILSSIPSVFSAPFLSCSESFLGIDSISPSCILLPRTIINLVWENTKRLPFSNTANWRKLIRNVKWLWNRLYITERCPSFLRLVSPFLPLENVKFFSLFMSQIFSRCKSVRLKRPGISHRIRNRHDREPIILVQHTYYRSFLLYLLTQFH